MSGHSINSRKGSSEQAPSIDNPKLESAIIEEIPVSEFQVSWDGENDQVNPMNWKASTKWLNLGVISVMSLIT